MSYIKSLLNSAPKIKYVVVPVPEMGKNAQVRLKEMDGEEILEFNDECNKHPDEAMIYWMARLITACAVDEDGNRIHKYDEYKLIVKALNRDGILVKIFQKAAELNGFTRKNVDDAKKGFKDSVIKSLARRICTDHGLPFFVVLKWPASEFAMWAAHYEMEYEYYESIKNNKPGVVELNKKDDDPNVTANAVLAVLNVM
ncbi:hypothetical protein QJS24_gp11 [Serratia phage vB_SmaS_Rovert]|uniref:Uncharacterized protein n=1 Tax=Serratia phage vB_SmaS_Rovert TaxID=2777363 RepID=A0A7T3TKY4_9CAUD|nr:hypothetical protein QJS24_gp11 [Serratia phage vB_SmaS_Rovert]QPX74980.1 hypothetical protein [Serratia phage vB_SmaS_Rovert]